MSEASRDFLKRNERERVRSIVRSEEYTNEFHDDGLAIQCFKVAVYEVTEEEQWRKILDRTRALLAKIRN